MSWLWRDDLFLVKYCRNPSSDRQVIKHHTADFADHAVCSHDCLTSNETWWDRIKQPTSTGKSRRWCVQEQPMTAWHTGKGVRMHLLSGDERLSEGLSVLGQPMCAREFGGIAEVFLLDMALRSHLHGQGHFFFLFRWEEASPVTALPLHGVFVTWLVKVFL